MAVARGEWRLVDRALVAYSLLVVVLGLTRLDHTGVRWIIAAHAGIALLALLTTRAQGTGFVRAMRLIYPVILLLPLYSSLDVMNGFGAVTTWDRQVQALEQAIFHMQPSRDWWRAHPSVVWSTILHAAYFSYYLIVPLPLIAFATMRNFMALERYLDAVMVTFLICFSCFLLFPVAGPYYEFARPTGEFVANFPARLVYGALSGGSSYGAAFPSSHVAATVAATVAGWMGSRRLGLIMLIPTALLAVAVVYCQMHYAVDSMAGIAVGLVVCAWTARARAGRREW